MTLARIAPAQALAALSPEFLANLSDLDALLLAFDDDLWLRPEQRIPRGNWRSWGVISGRGWGKSFAIAHEVNRRVREGECHAPALMAQNEPRAQEIQVAMLISTAPPWFRPEAYQGGVRWPNGVHALVFTPEAPGRSRSGNFDLSWLCEIVDWQSAERQEAYYNIATATRVGRAQILWDTTSKGKNEVIQHLLAEHERDPSQHLLQRGTSFDNPMLSRKYLAAICAQYVKGSRRYREEILGEVFAESAGALWQQNWIDENRVLLAPAHSEVTLIGLDPALSARSDADETGIVLASRDRAQDIHILADHSGRYSPEQWGSMIVDLCASGAAGVIVERNHAGDMPHSLIKVHAKERGLQVRLIAPDRFIPRRTPGVIYVKEVNATRSKESRASAPASLYQQGRVHHVGTYDELELELTTWEPGVSKSPNRLDALAYVVGELAELERPGVQTHALKDIEGAALASTELTKRINAQLRGRGRLGL